MDSRIISKAKKLKGVLILLHFKCLVKELNYLLLYCYFIIIAQHSNYLLFKEDEDDGIKH